ncbi:MAG: carboxypeptidase-like regulatory domain-containing protein, partial [Pseudonocardiaceae bacterium]
MAQPAPAVPAKLHRVVLGSVQSPDGSPLPAATLTLVDINGRQVDRGRSSRDGSYRLDAPETGNYLLICAAPPNGPTAERITVGPEITHHDVVMNPHP